MHNSYNCTRDLVVIVVIWWDACCYRLAGRARTLRWLQDASVRRLARRVQVRAGSALASAQFRQVALAGISICIDQENFVMDNLVKSRRLRSITNFELLYNYILQDGICLKFKETATNKNVRQN